MKRFTVICATAVACAALLIMAPLAHAQGVTGTVNGTVTDSQGAVIPGAHITITRVATKESRAAVTDNAGEYVFSLIEIGEYTVKCETQGFKTRTVMGLVLQTAQKLRVDLTLELGNVAETVEVRAAAVTLKTEDATVGQVIENRRIVELPLNGRNMSGLAVLVPGVQYGLRTGLADGSGGFPIPGAGVSVIANGIREVYNTISLDGVDAKILNKPYRRNDLASMLRSVLKGMCGAPISRRPCERRDPYAAASVVEKG